jgi:hypothetical protein
MMSRDDMTMSEVLRDPLIRLMLRADGISLGAFAELLETAARRRNAQFSNTENDGRSGSKAPLTEKAELAPAL